MSHSNGKAILVLGLLLATGLANGHTVPLVVAASDPLLQSFVRIINRSEADGVVSLSAFDDSGGRFGPVALSIGAGKTVHLNSSDLEKGNAVKGLPRGLGNGNGHWRLKLQSTLDIDVLAYMRSRDGFLTAMHDLAPKEGNRHLVASMMPANPAADRFDCPLPRTPCGPTLRPSWRQGRTA